MTDERDPYILIHFSDILPIKYTTPKLTQYGEISSVWNFPHERVRITWATLGGILFQWQIVGYKEMFKIIRDVTDVTYPVMKV
jgi:hypothetical protein